MDDWEDDGFDIEDYEEVDDEDCDIDEDGDSDDEDCRVKPELLSPPLFMPLAEVPVTLVPEVIFPEPTTEEIPESHRYEIQPEPPMAPEPIARPSLPPAPLAGETASPPSVAVSIDHSPSLFEPHAEAPVTLIPEVILPDATTDDILSSHRHEIQPEPILAPEPIARPSSPPAPLAGETVSLPPVAVSIDHSPPLFEPHAEAPVTLIPEVILPDATTDDILSSHRHEIQPEPILAPEPIARPSSPPAPLAGETVSLPPVAVSIDHSSRLFEPQAEVPVTIVPEVIFPEPITDDIPASHRHETQPEPILAPEPIARPLSSPAPLAGETVSLPPVAVSIDHSSRLFEPQAEVPVKLEPEVILPKPITDDILAPHRHEIQPEPPMAPEPIARPSLPPAPLAGETASPPSVAVSIDHSPPLFEPHAEAPVTLIPEVILPDATTDDILSSHRHEIQPEPILAPEPIARPSSPPAPLAGETVSLPPVAVSIDHSSRLFEPQAEVPVTIVPEVIFPEPITDDIPASHRHETQPEPILAPEPIARPLSSPAPLAGETVSLPPVAVSVDHSSRLFEPQAEVPVKLEPEVILPKPITDDILAPHRHEIQPEPPMAPEPIARPSLPPAPLAGETVSLPPVAVSVDHSSRLFEPQAEVPMTHEPEAILPDPTTDDIPASHTVEIQREPPLVPEQFTNKITLRTEPETFEQLNEDPEEPAADCFIATSAYGDPRHCDVMALRYFRDNYLKNFAAGRVFIRVYWLVGPVLAKFVRPTSRRGLYCRKALNRMIKALRERELTGGL